MDKNINRVILDDKIKEIQSSILSYENAIIEDHGKAPISEETINFYQQQINELVLIKSELEKL
jgi:hypothetical protein